eukprot:scaffold23546_cov19-Tisochrysis_lutea.AAC.1
MRAQEVLRTHMQRKVGLQALMSFLARTLGEQQPRHQNKTSQPPSSLPSKRQRVDAAEHSSGSAPGRGPEAEAAVDPTASHAKQGEAATPPSCVTSVPLSQLVAAAIKQRASTFGEDVEISPARLFLALLSLAHQVGGKHITPCRAGAAGLMGCWPDHWLLFHLLSRHSAAPNVCSADDHCNDVLTPPSFHPLQYPLHQRHSFRSVQSHTLIPISLFCPGGAFLHTDQHCCHGALLHIHRPCCQQQTQWQILDARLHDQAGASNKRGAGSGEEMEQHRLKSLGLRPVACVDFSFLFFTCMACTISAYRGQIRGAQQAWLSKQGLGTQKCAQKLISTRDTFAKASMNSRHKTDQARCTASNPPVPHCPLPSLFLLVKRLHGASAVDILF